MQTHLRPLTVALALLLFFGVTAVTASTDWPQYRGPDGQGIGSGTDWTKDAKEIGLKIDWKRSLGSGYSSLVIGDGKVVAFFHEGESEILAAVDPTSGRELWRHVAGPGYAGHDGSHDGPLSTPAIADGKIFAYHPTGRLFAVDASKGELVWEVQVAESFKANPPFYGFASSPLIVGNKLILQVGGETAFLAAFGLADGKTLWTLAGDRVQYQTPTVMRSHGQEILVAAGVKSLYGVAVESGEVLWSLEYEGAGSGFGAGGATPVPAGDSHIFVTHQDDKSVMVRLTEKDGKIVPEIAWESRNIRHGYDAPVYHDGYLYAFSSRFLVCVDAKSGDAVWRSRQPGDGFLSLVDDHLLIVTKEGSVHLAEATPEAYREVAGVQVFDDHSWTPPSFAGGKIYVRSLGEIARIGLTGKRTQSVAQNSQAQDLTGSRYGGFLTSVDKTDKPADKQAMVDKFFMDVEQTPIVEPGWVHFVYRGDATDVAVGGDLTEIEREQPMRRVPGTDLYTYSHPLENDARGNYVLFVDYEQTLDPRNPRKADIAVMGEDLTLSTNPDTIEMSWFSMPGWHRPEFLDPADAAKRGSLTEHEIPTEIAQAATAIQVYTPAGYDAAASRRYPVIYVHGGRQALALGGWQNALDRLTDGSVEPMIAVFLGPIAAFGPQATTVLADEIVPFVDENYRTKADAASRANVGGGFAGSNAFFATFGRPDVFSALGTHGAFVTEFAWNPLQQMIPAAKGQPLNVYMDWGKYDMRNEHENWNLREANQRLADFLQENGFAVSGGEAHDGTGWSSWRNRIDDLLRALFPKSP